MDVLKVLMRDAVACDPRKQESEHGLGDRHGLDEAVVMVYVVGQDPGARRVDLGGYRLGIASAG